MKGHADYVPHGLFARSMTCSSRVMLNKWGWKLSEEGGCPFDLRWNHGLERQKYLWQLGVINSRKDEHDGESGVESNKQ